MGARESGMHAYCCISGVADIGFLHLFDPIGSRVLHVYMLGTCTCTLVIP